MHTPPSTHGAQAAARRPVGMGPAAGDLSGLRPAQRGFFSRLQEVMLGRAVVAASAAEPDDPIGYLRPVAASGAFARLAGRIDPLSGSQRQHAVALLAQVRAPQLQTPAAALPGDPQDGMLQLARACADEWPDQVFDRAVEALRNDLALRRSVTRQMTAGEATVDGLLARVTQDCRASDTFRLRSASRAQAVLAAALAVVGDVQAQRVLADLRARLEALRADPGPLPLLQRLAALRALAASIDGAGLVVRTGERDRLRTEVAGLIQGLLVSQAGMEGDIRRAILSLGDRSTTLAPRIAALATVDTAIRAAEGRLPATVLESLRGSLATAALNLQAETRDAPTRAFALIRTLDPTLHRTRDAATLQEHRDLLADLREATQTCPGLAPHARQALARSIDWASQRLAVLEQPIAVLATCRELATARSEPACRQLAESIEGLRTSEYIEVCRRLQLLMDGIDPLRQDEALLALARAVAASPTGRDGKGEMGGRAFRETLIPALTTRPDVLVALFQAREWREEVCAFALAVVDDEERSVQAGVPEACERYSAGGVDFDAQRLRIDAWHNQRLVSDELDRLFLLSALRTKVKVTGGMVSGLASAFTALAPTRELIDGLCRVAPGVVEALDLRVVQWIALSAAAGLLSNTEAEALCRFLTGRDGAALTLEEALRHVRQGFPSTGAVVRCRQELAAFARKLQQAELVSVADRNKNPLAYADFVLRRVCERATGVVPDTVDGPAIAQAFQARWKQVEQRKALLVDSLDKRLAERDALLTGLRPLAGGGHPGAPGVAPCLWMREGQAYAGAEPAMRALVAYLAAAEALADLKGDTPAIRKAERALVTELETCRARLSGLDPVTLQVRDHDELPDPASLKAWLPMKATLEQLVNMQQGLARLQPQVEVERRRYEADMARLVEQGSQIALFQVALASGDPAFELSKAFGTQSTMGAQVVRRMGDLGLTPGRFPAGTPLNRRLIEQIEAMTTPRGRFVALGNLAALCAELDPTTLRFKAAAKVHGLVTPGAKAHAGTPAAPVKAPPAATGTAVRKKGGLLGRLSRAATGSAASQPAAAVSLLPSASASAAVPAAPARAEPDRLAIRLKALQPGEAFAIRFGRYGDQIVSQPVLPGLSVATHMGAERSDGIHILREGEGYEVEVIGRREVRFGVALQAFNEALGLSAEGSRATGAGLRFRFADLATCESMVRSLSEGRHIDLLAWREARVDQVAQTARTGRLEASINLGVAEAIAAVGAAVSAQVGVTREVRQSGAQDQEIVRRQLALIAEAHGTAAQGRLEGHMERGLDRTVTRHVIREQGLLKTQSGAVLSVRVVGGRVPQALQTLMPGLGDAAAQALAERIGEVETHGELQLRCRLSAAAIGEANAHLRRANQALLDAALTVDRDRLAEAGRQARAAAEAAEKVLQKADSYVVEGLHVRRRDEVRAEASRGVFKNFATSEDASLQAIDLSLPAAAGAGAPVAEQALPAAYDGWMSMGFASLATA